MLRAPTACASKLCFQPGSTLIARAHASSLHHFSPLPQAGAHQHVLDEVPLGPLSGNVVHHQVTNQVARQQKGARLPDRAARPHRQQPLPKPAHNVCVCRDCLLAFEMSSGGCAAKRYPPARSRRLSTPPAALPGPADEWQSLFDAFQAHMASVKMHAAAETRKAEAACVISAI